MGNHIHLLLHELKEETGIIMRRIGASYVYWYNWKYKRCGHLFQDRYKSEAVETDEYLLTVLRYIHRNPIKAGFAKRMTDYKWSSYNEYIGNKGVTDIDFALNIIDENRENAVMGFIKYHAEQKEDKCGITSSLKLKDFDKEEQDNYIKQLKGEGLSSRQIERLTGVSRAIILNA